MRKKTILLAAVLSMLGSMVQAGDCNAPAGESNWKDGLGSTMTINIDSGNVTGTYNSIVNECNKPSVTGPVKGTCSGDSLDFTVVWPLECGDSYTFWQGQLINGEIIAPWALYVKGRKPSPGLDIFTQ